MATITRGRRDWANGDAVAMEIANQWEELQQFAQAPKTATKFDLDADTMFLFVIDTSIYEYEYVCVW